MLNLKDLNWSDIVYKVLYKIWVNFELNTCFEDVIAYTCFP